MYISDIDIAGYPETSYIVPDNIDVLIKSFEESSAALFQQFYNNLLKSNPYKCQLLTSSNEKEAVKIGKYEIENSKCENYRASN